MRLQYSRNSEWKEFLVVCSEIGRLLKHWFTSNSPYINLPYAIVVGKMTETSSLPFDSRFVMRTSRCVVGGLIAISESFHTANSVECKLSVLMGDVKPHITCGNHVFKCTQLDKLGEMFHLTGSPHRDESLIFECFTSAQPPTSFLSTC